jgi:hypothetical protein
MFGFNNLNFMYPYYAAVPIVKKDVKKDGTFTYNITLEHNKSSVIDIKYIINIINNIHTFEYVLNGILKVICKDKLDNEDKVFDKLKEEIDVNVYNILVNDNFFGSVHLKKLIKGVLSSKYNTNLACTYKDTKVNLKIINENTDKKTDPKEIVQSGGGKINYVNFDNILHNDIEKPLHDNCVLCNSYINKKKQLKQNLLNESSSILNMNYFFDNNVNYLNTSILSIKDYHRYHDKLYKYLKHQEN